MHTYTKIIYHVMFHTKNNRKTIKKAWRENLQKYIFGILNNKKCFCYQIGGTEDHIHLAFALHPSVSLADLIHDVKIFSSRYIKDELRSPDFEGWQSGYAAITHSEESLKALIEYIAGQEEHHQKEDSKKEYIRNLQNAKIEYNERFLF
jgi:putative transposase